MKCTIYVRLSQEDRNKENIEDDSNSIQNQKTMLIQYALKENWEIYNIYSDDDYTGADRNRPQFNQLLQDTKNRQFDIILCKSHGKTTIALILNQRGIPNPTEYKRLKGVRYKTNNNITATLWNIQLYRVCLLMKC